MSLVGRGLRAAEDVWDSPKHDRCLVQQLEPHVQLEKWRRRDEELVVVGGDVVSFDGSHERWHEMWWIEGLKIHDCEIRLVLKTRRKHG